MDINKINDGMNKLLPVVIKELEGFDIAEKIGVLQATAGLLQNTLAAESMKEIYKNVFSNLLKGPETK
jgi:hypothetical protein